MRTPSHVDAELVATLERAFAHHAGVDAKIDVADLQRALDLRSEYLARRVLAAFDSNGDGVVSREEFLEGVRQLVVGTDREKLAFAFRIHDHDGDGLLDRQELFRMIAISLAESGVAERETQPPSDLAEAVLRAADANGDGKLSLDELEAAVKSRPELLARMTRSEAIWIAPNEELLLLLDERAKPAPGRFGRWLEDHGAELVFVVAWIAANAGVFVWSMIWGRAGETTDPAMRLGRAIGACLDLNGGIVFLPMMRRLLTWMRAKWIGRVVPLDRAIDFHKLVGHTLYALAVTHAAAFAIAYGGGHGDPLGVLDSGLGATGGALLVVFTVMWIFALGFVRRRQRFELFYFTHLLFVVWLGLAVAHAPRILLFSGVPVLGFVVEQILRLRRRRPPSKVVSAFPLRSGVTRLEITRPPGFVFGAGDYVFLRLPALARHEWHPFTISSAPEAENLAFHVRSLGNWTSALRRHAEEKRSEPLAVHVDGPYGSPSAHIFASKHAVLVGAGIGVTPFASVLESVVLRANGEGRPSSLEKVHFFWLNRDPYSFEWFRGLLSRLEDADEKRMLDIHLCMTGARTGVTAFGLELAREIMHAAGRSDLVTGLRTKTHMGKPDWEKMLGDIAKQHAPDRVEVFFCGPHGLAKKLQPICHHLGMTFREEKF
ncbi:MAG TPA: EF-hand domain-containing protein [Labilithrix sp.]|jgi:predicted ferric reductase/Ca2+-binding EF-hand superfamily protein